MKKKYRRKRDRINDINANTLMYKIKYKTNNKRTIKERNKEKNNTTTRLRF